MTKRVLASALLALGAAVVAAAQTTPTKIGVIQIQAAIISTREGKKAAADLEARSAPKKKELEKQQAEINALRDQLQKSSNTASEDVKQ
ncbi:MAG: hypothetical protein HYZ57_09385 [Acidobacteria bacterium]|nr:hypothetical protein [Acidobacteriota bacterium]